MVRSRIVVVGMPLILTQRAPPSALRKLVLRLLVERQFITNEAETYLVVTGVYLGLSIVLRRVMVAGGRKLLAGGVS